MRKGVWWGLLLVLIGGWVWIVVTRDDPQPSDAPNADGEREAASPDAMKATGLEGSAAKMKAKRAADAEAAEAQLPSIHGRILDAATGEGIPGVRVIAASWHEVPVERHAYRLGMSGADGAFRVKGLRDGRWLLIPFHPQYLQPFVGSLFDDPLDAGEDLPSVDDYWSEAESQGLTLNVQGGKVSDEPLE
ncbi:MAG: carboxypeptidase-like regulatory domain-containing protein, partial [Planctomycetota bacterium]|nr:carboxypeptidase-like regulatory domain-containing protein [Planctomycetota bacterium]